MGSNVCSPSPETIDGVFAAAQAGGIIPDITLDRTSSNYLSLNSNVVLNRQYRGIKERFSSDQLTALDNNLTSVFGQRATVPFGGVGIVALALSLLLDTLVDNVAGHGDAEAINRYQRMFGPDSNSKVSNVTVEYLRLIPWVVKDGEEMADLTDVYDQKLKLALLELFESITVKNQINTAAIKQWINGAAIHLHMRIHGVRLRSVPRGSVESLRLTYKTGLERLVKLYASYLRHNVKERATDQGPPIKAGFLITEPNKKVRHRVVHSPCQSPGIIAAVAEKILSVQNLQAAEALFEEAGRNLNKLVQQREHFELLIGNMTQNSDQNSSL